MRTMGLIGGFRGIACPYRPPFRPSRISTHGIYGGEGMPAMNPVELDQLFGEALNLGNIEALLALYEPEAKDPGTDL